MRVLVAWGSSRGGTAGIARIIGETLKAEGIQTEIRPAAQIKSVRGFDAVIIGGALYANRWHRHARQLVDRCEAELASVPTWLFSSGPLDASAESGRLPPVRMVLARAERIGAQGHETFGGRLRPDASGPIARTLAREHSGDWRDVGRIRAWAENIARSLPRVRPRQPGSQQGRSLARLLSYGFVGWMTLEFARGALALATRAPVAATIAAPFVFAGISVHYFRDLQTRAPLQVGAVFAAIVLFLDWLTSGPLAGPPPLHTASYWLATGLVFTVSHLSGEFVAMLPASREEAA